MLAAQPRTVGAGHPAWIVVPPFERTSMSSPRICRESCPWFETTEHPSVLDALTCLSAAWAPLMFTGSALRASGNSLNVIRARIGKDQCKGSFPSGAGGVVWGRPRATMWDVRGRSSITIAHMNQFICRSCFSNSRSNCVSLCDFAFVCLWRRSAVCSLTHPCHIFRTPGSGFLPERVRSRAETTSIRRGCVPLPSGGTMFGRAARNSIVTLRARQNRQRLHMLPQALASCSGPPCRSPSVQFVTFLCCREEITSLNSHLDKLA